MSHVADGFTIFTGQVLVPGAGKHDIGRQADGAHAGEVVLQGCRTIHIGQTHLADRLDGRILIASVGDEVVHVIEGELIEQPVPLGVVVVDATQVDKSQTVPCTGSWHVVGVVVELGRIVVADIVEGGLILIRHGIVDRACQRLLRIGEVVGAAQIVEPTVRIVEHVGGYDGIVVVSVVFTVVGDGRSHVHGLFVNDAVRVGTYGDSVIS